jgi:hypothetical protein
VPLDVVEVLGHRSPGAAPVARRDPAEDQPM